MKFIKPIPAPQKTFFFERANGSWFAAEEYEANLHLKRTHNTVKLVGTSDGVSFHNKLRTRADELNKKLEDLSKQLKYKKIDEETYDNECDLVNKELLEFINIARAEEYEASKGRIVLPVDPQAERAARDVGRQSGDVSRILHL